MDKVQKIIHIVNRDAFATGYIEFMRVHFTQYEHLFILLSRGVDLGLDMYDDVQWVEHYKELRFTKQIHEKLKKCDKIIVSGVWDMPRYLFKCGRNVLTKTYFHFWGGDFYKYREFSTRDVKRDKRDLRRCLKKCAGIITLIEEDYPALLQIIDIPDRKHFVAPMGKNPKENIDYAYYRSLPKRDHVFRILVGNSATVYNHHEEIFEILAVYKDADIEIICPLSYGKEEYRNQVIESGEKYFGEKFHAVLERIPKDEYVSFLSSCDVGIFNNNRQQAMGNISIFARLGKKVYIRDDTPMWEHFRKVGYCFSSVEELKDQTLEEIVTIDPKVRENNILARERWEQKTVVLWDKVLQDESYLADR